MASSQQTPFANNSEKGDTPGETFAIGSEEVALPEDIPGKNDAVRAVFSAYDGAEALQFFVGQKIVYLLPWAARQGGVAGYEQVVDSFCVRPVEYTPNEVCKLLDQHRPRRVPLANTPAWLLDDRGGKDVHITWHARVRWGERVSPSPDPAPAIREAFEDSVSVGIERSHGRYYAPEDVVLAYVYRDRTPVVTTIYHPDTVQELGADHLTECPQCGELYDPGNHQTCTCCMGPVCPWCGDTVA
jgi:hypothetical protein